MSDEKPIPESHESAPEEASPADEVKQPRQGSKRKKIALVAGVAIAAILIIFWALKMGNADHSKRGAATLASEKSVGTPNVTAVYVVLQEVNKLLRLPGELQAYQDVAIYPKVQGFVASLNVDRGSVVRRGQTLIQITAPELSSNINEAEARVRGATEQRIEMQARWGSSREQKAQALAKLASDEGTYRRLKGASATPGVVAENDVDIARETVEADRALVRAYEENERAAQAVVQSQRENEHAASSAARTVRDIESYLRITAPFAGIITERNVHTGSLVGPTVGPASPPMLRIQQISLLRLIVAVPETDVAGVTPATRVNFTVPAFPGETFWGVVRRISHVLDEKTRTMPVELDVINESGRLAPGMFPEVLWPTSRPKPSLLVPASAIATTTERTFVIRISNGVTQWVDVKRGISMGDLVEVFGDLQENDLVAVRGTDELRSGTSVDVKQEAATQLKPAQ